MFREIKRKPPELLLKVQEVLNECFFSPFLEGLKKRSNDFICAFSPRGRFLF